MFNILKQYYNKNEFWISHIMNANKSPTLTCIWVDAFHKPTYKIKQSLELYSLQNFFVFSYLFFWLTIRILNKLFETLIVLDKETEKKKKNYSQNAYDHLFK